MKTVVVLLGGMILVGLNFCIFVFSKVSCIKHVLLLWWEKEMYWTEKREPLRTSCEEQPQKRNGLGGDGDSSTSRTSPSLCEDRQGGRGTGRPGGWPLQMEWGIANACSWEGTEDLFQGSSVLPRPSLRWNRDFSMLGQGEQMLESQTGCAAE